MRPLYILSLAILLSPLFASAQSKYQPGYIVTLNGDTVKCQVLYKKGQKDFKFVKILKPGSTQPEQFRADQTAGFGVYGVASYQSFTVRISQDTPLDMNFTIGKDTTAVVDDVFLRRLITGPVITLYSYTDKIKQRFYISEKNAAPVELVCHEYMDAENQLKPVVDADYKRQLQKLRVVYQPGNKALSDQIQKAEYSLSNLAKIAVKLNTDPTSH